MSGLHACGHASIRVRVLPSAPHSNASPRSQRIAPGSQGGGGGGLVSRFVSGSMVSLPASPPSMPESKLGVSGEQAREMTNKQQMSARMRLVSLRTMQNTTCNDFVAEGSHCVSRCDVGTTMWLLHQNGRRLILNIQVKAGRVGVGCVASKPVRHDTKWGVTSEPMCAPVDGDDSPLVTPNRCERP